MWFYPWYLKAGTKSIPATQIENTKTDKNENLLTLLKHSDFKPNVLILRTFAN